MTLLGTKSPLVNKKTYCETHPFAVAEAQVFAREMEIGNERAKPR